MPVKPPRHPQSSPLPTTSILTTLIAGLLAAVTPTQGGGLDRSHGSSTAQREVLVEAESFAEHGGWKLDTQFIHEMGSPYLLAHGLGRKVADATTRVHFAAAGKYRVWVRTKDWVARWKAKGAPGRFHVLVDGQVLATTFGTKSAAWHWHDGGVVEIDKREVELALRDLTGFGARCDAIYFAQCGASAGGSADASKAAGDNASREEHEPPNDASVLPAWRRKLLGLAEKATDKRGYDLVVIGGGYSGLGAALSAARMGCKVALIQNRGVLGGNGSSEVRVWSQGHIRRGRYPRIGEIIAEIADRASKSPGRAEEFGDAHKERIVRAERNIDLFLHHHAYRVETQRFARTHDGYERHIAAVHAFDVRTSEHKRFVGRNYVDATGHGTIGALADADWDMTAKGRMGMSNMWRWDDGKTASKFDASPWALDLEMKDFPYPRDHHGQWFWESGFDKDPLQDAEGIRDWNLRALFGAFHAMKNRGDAKNRAKHAKAYLSWVAFIGGPRESRRLLGDVVLTQDDIVTKKQFADGCVPSTWTIDLHYPKKQYAKKFPDNPFISIAVHDRRVDRSYGYPVPYRCFYSRNVDNLFMAGRCISVTHEALGTVRVMRTCGMMGEVVGRAASICAKEGCTPRAVYQKHWEQMDELLRLPGKARRRSVDAKIVIPDDAMDLASPTGPKKAKRNPHKGIAASKLGGVVVDDHEAERKGHWVEGGLAGFVGRGYVYAGADSGASIRYSLTAPSAGDFEVRISYCAHENRAPRAPVRVQVGKREPVTQRIDMRKKPPLAHNTIRVARLHLAKGERVQVTLGTKGAGGTVHADAVQLLQRR